jgi:MbtH protein
VPFQLEYDSHPPADPTPMSNPFDDKDGEFLALINEEGQYSLWPAFMDVPAGWTIAHPRASRDVCLNFINTNWTDMRPKSLIDATKAP